MTMSSLEPPRKRLRKGTKSCIEYIKQSIILSKTKGKRRKIKCVFVSDSHTVCVGCTSRGAPCLSQDDPAVVAVEERIAAVAQLSSADVAVHDRLARVEALLSKVAEKLEVKVEDDVLLHHGQLQKLEEVFDVVTPSTASLQLPNGRAPFLKMFDQAIFGEEGTDNSEHTRLVTSQRAKDAIKLDRLTKKLVPQLPLQEDVDTIVRESNGWYIVLSFHVEPNGHGLLGEYTIQSLAKAHPVLIARSFITIAMSLQQLQSTFPQHLFRGLRDVEASSKNFMALAKLVTADDDLMSCREGLTCLLLEAVYYLNEGKSRTSWLIFRRAINLAQLVGFHRNTKQMKLDKPNEEIPSEACDQLWRYLVQAEAYLALLLGLPSAVSPTLCERSLDPYVDAQIPIINFYQRMMIIINKIIERDQTGCKSYNTTQAISEDIERLKIDMPSDWWDIPAYEKFVFPLSARQQEIFDRMYMQMWFYNLEALLHLPFMLRSGVESRYEYSQRACLQAYRQLIKRYLYIRDTDLVYCTVMVFQAFTAVVTILLKLLCTSSSASSCNNLNYAEKEEDYDMVRKVERAFEESLKNNSDVVIKQSVKVLRTLLAVGKGESQELDGGIKLVIPYFGTLSINRTRKECEMARWKVQGQRDVDGVVVEDNGVLVADQLQNGQLGIQTPPPYDVADFLGSQIQFSDAPLTYTNMQVEPLLEGWFYDLDGNSNFQNFFF